nr:ribonuclease H-like domain-containing protein [Tanacetum cinerariifolium]
MHNSIMAAGLRDRPPILAKGRYAQWQSRLLRRVATKPNGESLRKFILQAHDMWIAIEMLQQGESLNKHDTGQFRNQRTVNVVGLGRLKPKRAKDYTYHKEKMLLCKQAKKGVPLQAQQADWLKDTDEEIDEQELEAHYSFMEKIHEFLHVELGSDAEPLEKKDIVIDLPKLKYDKDQLCSSCKLRKAKRSTFKTKAIVSSKGRLNLLHIDLCGPMWIESINEKKYILVIVDDYSRYTWTHFLRTKDETPEVELDGKIVKEKEEVVKRIKGEALKEIDDPEAFIFPIRLKGQVNGNALADTGLDIYTMPYRIYEQLGREDMKNVDREIMMINHTQAEAKGILINVLYQVGVTTLIAKFLIMDISIEHDSPIVVGRGILRTIGGIVNTLEILFSTFDGFCHLTLRAARFNVMRNAKSDSDDEEDYQIKRNKFGAPIYGPKPASYLNCNDPVERSLAIQI